MTGGGVFSDGRAPIVIGINGRVAREELPALYARACARLLDSDAALVICDVGGLTDLDAVALDALVRLQLAARRSGRQLRIRNASCELLELLDLAGLRDVVPSCGPLLGPSGQVEEWEQRCGIEEEADPDDLTG